MLKQLFNNIKNIFIENYKSIILFIIFAFFLFFKLPFYIEKTGGTINLEDRINNSKYSGSLNMSYVSMLETNIPAYIISLFKDDWDAIPIEEENGTSTSKEMEIADKIALEESIDAAIINAYRYSNKDIKITSENVYVAYVYPNTKTNLKVGDILKKIDNVDINFKSDATDYLKTLNYNQKVTFEVINNNKKYKRYAIVSNYKNKKVIGVATYTDYKIKSNKIKNSFKNKETGPSGGLMLSLAIYSKINNVDLTNGKNIAGTGTIDIDGNVGSIGGVKYKLAGAVKDNMDIFIVPNGPNYKEAIKEKKKHNYKIKIYGVNTFDDAINILKKLGNS